MILLNYIAVWLIAFNFSTAFSTQKDDQNLAALAPHKQISNQLLIESIPEFPRQIFNSKGTSFSELKSSLPKNKDDIIDKDYFVIETQCMLPPIKKFGENRDNFDRLIHDFQLRPVLNVNGKAEYLDSSSIVCIRSTPETNVGSTSFSSGFSESFSGNIGFFGKTPTGGVSGSYSWSSGTSFNASDVVISNLTEGEKARWRVKVYPYSDVCKKTFQPSFTAVWQAVNSGSILRKKLEEKQDKDLSLSFELSYSSLLQSGRYGARDENNMYDSSREWQKKAIDILDEKFSFLFTDKKAEDKYMGLGFKVMTIPGGFWSSDQEINFWLLPNHYKTSHFYSIKKDEYNEHINIPLYIP